MLKVADKKKILLVDDDQSATESLSALFETRGYDVTVANSGQEALKKVSNSTDLVLLDIALPDQEGFQLCRKLKENEKTSDVNIIILTGRLMTCDIVEGLYLGADDYLTKPFEFEELIARMEAVMRRRSIFNSGRFASREENDVIMELRRIIDNELVIPYFQPIFLLNPLVLYGFESLSRPQTQSVLSAPDLLFKAAIQFGVYQDLELLAWKKALEYASEHIDGRKLFFNCNPYLIEGAKFSVIKALFEDNKVDISDVYLEITERSAITNFKAFYENLGLYRDHGFKFAIDDVGGGYASLEAIVEIRPEVVKIDRHIVHQLSGDSLRFGIVKFIVSFCKEHGILSIAEGIETKKDFETVKELGIDAGQGFYFSRPEPHIGTNNAIMKSVAGC